MRGPFQAFASFNRDVMLNSSAFVGDTGCAGKIAIVCPTRRHVMRNGEPLGTALPLPGVTTCCAELKIGWLMTLGVIVATFEMETFGAATC